MESITQVTQSKADNHHPPIHIWVDGEEYTTDQRELTANQIITNFGKKDPATNYLVEIQGNHKVSFQGKGDELIKLHNNESFQIVSTGPTPVSSNDGPTVFAEGLRTLGFNPQALRNMPDHLVFNYPVEVGGYAGKMVRLGFVVPPDFPNITPSGPHVSPPIHPFHPSNDLPHPHGGVHPSPEFEKSVGGKWQYWSRPCKDWGQRRRTVVAYMAHIWRLWETQ
jgi:hypothetical protein